MKNLFRLYFFTIYFLFSQTSQQLQQAKQYIKANGMSINEVERAAKAQGLSDKQIESGLKKLNTENLKNNEEEIDFTSPINNLSLGKSNNITNDNIFAEKQSIIKSLPDLKDNYLDDSKTLNPYFGYDVFRQDPALFQASSVGAVDPDYLIGPGDEIIVMLWGETQFRVVLIVDREGFVFVPEIGQVFVNGLNLNLLESKLYRVLSQAYASLDPQGRKATTFLDISLGNLRPLRIQVLGQVAQPGAYTVSPSATLFSSLYYFNGPTVSGSLRDIQLIRNGKKIGGIDFYDYLLSGKKPMDQNLQLDDVIFIPNRLKTVSILGEINHPGIYELKPDESLKDVLEMSGGLKITAYLDRVQIDRIVEFEDRIKLGMDRLTKDVDLNEFINSKKIFFLQDGDKIEVSSIIDLRENLVEILGAVNRPGTYELGDSLNVKNLIDKANGLLGVAYSNRIELVRTNKNGTKQLLKLNLQKILENDISHNIPLKSFDRLTIYDFSKLQSKNVVSIRGPIKSPGSVELLDGMRVYDLLFTGIGLIDDDQVKNIYMKRADIFRSQKDKVNKIIIPINLNDIIKNQNKDINIKLQKNDVIQIYSKSIFEKGSPVFIDGVVKNTGKYILKEDMSIKDLLLLAGGVNENVFKFKVTVSRIDPINTKENFFTKTFQIEANSNSGLYKFSQVFNSDNGDIFQFKLEPYDHIFIRSDPNFSLQKIVQVDGEVYFPGNYAIQNSSEKLTDIITRAGGLKKDAYPIGSIFTRRGKTYQIDLEKILNKKNQKRILMFLMAIKSLLQ